MTQTFSQRSNFKSASSRILASMGIGCLLPILIASAISPAYAAKEDGCAGGAFSIITSSSILTGNQNATIPKGGLGTSFSVQGKFVSFNVVSNSFGVLNYTFSSAAGNSQPIVAFASKLPNLQSLVLSSDVSVSLQDETLVLKRTGTGIAMTIQANDCASGGIFQMEPERGDGATTDIVHTLGSEVFYFNNPNFGALAPPLPLCPAGGPFTPACTPVPITPRVNFATDISRSFVGRDSPQSATKIAQSGGSSTWRVASGGRMGGVFGEDAVEVAPPAVPCTSHCQAQDQVRGKFPVLGFPFPVPVAARISPR
jgi:hypothetical protein